MGPMTTHALSDSRLANLGARAAAEAYTSLSHRFRIITRRARIRFAGRDWKGMAADAAERLDLYGQVARETAVTVRSILGERVDDRMVWAAMKAVFSGLIADRPDWELAETFFNSVTRRIFSTVGVDPRIEFVDTDYDVPPREAPHPVYRTYGRHEDLTSLMRQIIADGEVGGAFVDLVGDAVLAAERIEEHLRTIGALRTVDRVEVISSVFYRGKGAYVVGRLFSGSHTVPLVLAFLHPAEGVVLDAVLLTENEVSILFSFARSYFHVDAESPYALVGFLASIMPRKRRAELYISIGHNKHGKTELYRDLRRYLAETGERFEPARGTPGLVMEVFTLPGFDVVFKVIKDSFGEPKRITRLDVFDRYRLVYRHDRAGRLVDAQEFEHLEFDRDRFDPGLLERLATNCAKTVTVEATTVTIHHAYVERRVIPLDVFLREADPAAAREAIVDYGRAIKDMAASGVFPGDMLLKNFGVTRHGRVVFYDYDELRRLSECNFRRIPEATDPLDELGADPWFTVGPDDVFPEEFGTFLGVQGELREAFLARHRDLFDPNTWRDWQERVAAGEIIEIYPYKNRARLRGGR